jgi:hypothetical protein
MKNQPALQKRFIKFFGTAKRFPQNALDRSAWRCGGRSHQRREHATRSPRYVAERSREDHHSQPPIMAAQFTAGARVAGGPIMENGPGLTPRRQN